MVEMKVQIQGVPGDFCSPSCSVASPCPEDPYRGATARGMCVLQTPGSDKPNRCALVCNPRDDAPNGGCPKGASCRPVAQVDLHVPGSVIAAFGLVFVFSCFFVLQRARAISLQFSINARQSN